METNMLCRACGVYLEDGGPVGLYCPNGWKCKASEPIPIPPVGASRIGGDDAKIARLAREYVARYKTWIKEGCPERTVCPMVCLRNALIAAVQEEGK
jgi:hypothetical protein